MAPLKSYRKVETEVLRLRLQHSCRERRPRLRCAPRAPHADQELVRPREVHVPLAGLLVAAGEVEQAVAVEVADDDVAPRARGAPLAPEFVDGAGTRREADP